MRSIKSRRFVVFIISILAVSLTLLYFIGGVGMIGVERDIKPINVTPAGDTKKEVKLSSHDVVIDSEDFSPVDFDIHVGESGEDEVSKGQVKFVNNASRSHSVNIQERNGSLVTSFSVPPGSSRKHPVFESDKGEYVFTVSDFNSTGSFEVV